MACNECEEQIHYPIDYILAMILEHKKATGHNDYSIRIPDNLKLKVE